MPEASRPRGTEEGWLERGTEVNLPFLMWVVLLPFSASLLGEFGYPQIIIGPQGIGGTVAE